MLATLYKFLKDSPTPSVEKAAYAPVSEENSSTICFRINNNFYFADRDYVCDIFSVKHLNSDRYILTVVGAADIHHASIQSDDNLVLSEILELVHIINEYIILMSHE